MGRPNKLTGKASRQRVNLHRKRHPFLVRFQLPVWKQLQALAEDGESATEALERLVKQATPHKHICA